MKKILIMLMTILLLGFCTITGCGSKNKALDEGLYKIYYRDQSKIKLVAEDYVTEEKDKDKLIAQLFERMTGSPESVECSSALPDNIRILWTHYDAQQNMISVSFSSDYYELNSTDAILCRAAVTKTLCQIPDVEYISFLIGNNNLKDASGRDISKMNLSMLIDNNDLEALKRMEITLYFTDESGKKLIECDRDVVFSNAVSNERLVISQLIEGPNEDGVYPTLPEDLNILSINVSDGICYVNFDAAFIDNSLNLGTDISVYSLVNSLTELSTVNKVQIMVDGTPVSDLDLDVGSGPLDRNLDYVGTLEED